MDYIEAGSLSFSELNETIRSAGAKCRVSACLGQRFIAAGMSRKSIEIDGIPGNALGAYLNGADITVHGNAQDAVGDTMSAGRIVSTATSATPPVTPCAAERSSWRATRAIAPAST